MLRRLHFALSCALLVASNASEQPSCSDPSSLNLHLSTRYGDGQGDGVGELNTPFMAVAADGLVFVSDFWNHRIQVYRAADGEFNKTIGRKGTGPGEIMFPMGLAIKDSRLYVTEGLNHRVQVLTFEGESLHTFGEQGTGDGQLNYPPSIALGVSTAFVSDDANDRVLMFVLGDDKAGTFAGLVGAKGTGSGQFSGPKGLSFDAGELFVVDGGGRVQVFTITEGEHGEAPVANFARELRHPKLAGAYGVAARGERLYVSAMGAESGVRAFTKQGEYLHAVRLPGGSVHCPLLSVDALGLLAADGEAHFVQRLLVQPEPPAPLLTQTLAFSEYGAKPGQVNYPYQAAAGGPKGEVFVADQFNHRISVFTAEGDFVRSFAGKGSGAGEFEYPMGLHVHGEMLLVADGAGRRINVFSLVGDFLFEFGGPRSERGALQDPLGVVVERASSEVFVVDYGFDCIQVYDLKGEYKRRWGSPGRGAGQFDNPAGIAVHGGRVYVTDRNRVQSFGAATGELLSELRSRKLAGATGIAVTDAGLFVSGSVKGVGFVRSFAHDGTYRGEYAPASYRKLGLASAINGTHLLVTDETAHQVYMLAFGDG